MTTEDGSRRYIGESQICPKFANDALQSFFRWHKCQITNLPPIIGRGIALLGGRPAFPPSSIPDDGYANDAVWRPPPSVFRNAALQQVVMSDSEFPTPQGRTQIHQSAGTDINFALTRAGPTGSRALTRLPTSIREWPCESRLL